MMLVKAPYAAKSIPSPFPPSIFGASTATRNGRSSSIRTRRVHRTPRIANAASTATPPAIHPERRDSVQVRLPSPFPDILIASSRSVGASPEASSGAGAQPETGSRPGRAARTRRSWTTLSALSGRRAGSFSSSDWTSAASSGRTRPSGSEGASATLRRVSTGVFPRNGERPASIS